MSAIPAPRSRHIPSLASADIALAAALTGFAVLEVGLVHPARLWPDAGIAVIATAPLAVRRRVPLASVAGVCVALLLTAAAGEKSSTYTSLLVAALVALYSLGAYAANRQRVAGLLAALVAAVWSALSQPRHGGSDALFAAGVIALPWTVGVASHRRDRSAARLRERAERLEREQETRERTAVAAERQRIARELHDIVAHAVTLMVIQANAGERQVHTDPAAAERAFAVVRESGKAALHDLRRMLDLLRSDPGQAARVPQLPADAIEQLVEDTRYAGTQVELDSDPLDDLPESLLVAVHRLLQEALTNATRHAHGAAIAIRIQRHGNELRLSVRNAAGHPIADAAGSGYGLIGMRERTAVFGGSFHAQPEPDGGFHVEITLPLGQVS